MGQKLALMQMAKSKVEGASLMQAPEGAYGLQLQAGAKQALISINKGKMRPNFKTDPSTWEHWTKVRDLNIVKGANAPQVSDVTKDVATRVKDVKSVGGKLSSRNIMEGVAASLEKNAPAAASSAAAGAAAPVQQAARAVAT
ncbi:MAG: hypothetical protein MHM6MM_008685 [Cercozoa sp. M6MM]